MIQEPLPAWPDAPSTPWLNPWLSLPPPLFFWLGADAEPAWPTFNGLTVAAPAFMTDAHAWVADWRTL